jgi:putative transcriptional regulator
MANVFNELMSGLDDVESFLSGKTAGFKVHLPEKVDVKEIRNHLHMTQAKFSDTFGFSLDAVKHWEGGRRTPDPSARAYLTIIEKAPEVVIGILSPEAISHAKAVSANKYVHKHATKRNSKAKRSKDAAYAYA